MILKINNKHPDFYYYMGKFFGSRIVQTETKDRIYDDNIKTWYIYIDSSNKPYGFISIVDSVIKNIYCSNSEYLKELLYAVKKDVTIQPSIVTKLYESLYYECGFDVSTLDNYKHFVMIRGEKNEEKRN